MTSGFKDKHAVITGGANGIGRAVALAFAHAGTKVSIFDIDEGEGIRTRDALQEAGATAQFFPVDVSSERAVKDAVTHCQRDMGDIHILHNHAGTVVIKPFLEMTVEEWISIYEEQIKR